MTKNGFVTKGTQALEGALLNMQRRHGALLETLCVLAAGIVFLVGIFIPFTVQNRALSGQITQRRAEIARRASLLANKERIAADYERLFHSALDSPDADLSVSALKTIERIAESSSVKIVNIRQNRTLSGTSLRQVVVEFTTQAQKGQYVRFLYALRAPESLFTVRKCSLQARKDGSLIDGQFYIVYNAA
jgi:hypothetical protein